MKQCSTCKAVKPLSDFHANKARHDGKAPSCKVCRKQHNEKYYQNTKEKFAQQRRENKKALLERNRAIIVKAVASGCVDCGEKDLRVLEFDHLGDKEANVADLRTGSVERLELEIAKCEVVCANCHRIRTCERQGNWRSIIPV